MLVMNVGKYKGQKLSEKGKSQSNRCAISTAISEEAALRNSEKNAGRNTSKILAVKGRPDGSVG